MEIIPLDIEANLAKAEKILETAVQAGKLDLAVFPEDCITGPIPHNLDYALDENSEAIIFFKKLAQKHKIYIVCGSFIKMRDNKYYHTSLLIDRKGEVILEYEKNNLWIPERNYLTSGSELPVVKTDIGTMGLTICWDLAFPETFRQLAKQGADIICCPSYWTKEDSGLLGRRQPGVPTEVNMVDTLCPARAIENEMMVIYANGAKKADIFLRTKKIGLNQIGHSQICIPLYGTVEKMDNNEEGFVYYSYDRKIAKDAEDNYKLREDMLAG